MEFRVPRRELTQGDDGIDLDMTRRRSIVLDRVVAAPRTGTAGDDR
jgi:hypothetical protein